MTGTGASHGPAPNARRRLLDAAREMIRRKGFTATSVDELCAAAGVTKGAFFHHFASKEALGVAAARDWSEGTGALFAAAPYHAPADPLDRIFAYLDFREALLAGDVQDFTCLVGTLIQEIHESSPAIRDAALASVTGHAATLEADFDAVLDRMGRPEGLTAESLALHTQVVLQGAFILSKGHRDAAPARDSLNHLRRYLALLLQPPTKQ